jgi:hypothetical protein
VHSTSGYFLPVIITLFSTLAFVAILVAIFGVIFMRRKDSKKKQRQKNENKYKFNDKLENYDDVVYENEDNSYEIMNYKLDNYDIGVYDEINENESKIEANTSQTVEHF